MISREPKCRAPREGVASTLHPRVAWKRPYSITYAQTTCRVPPVGPISGSARVTKMPKAPSKAARSGSRSTSLSETPLSGAVGVVFGRWISTSRSFFKLRHTGAQERWVFVPVTLAGAPWSVESYLTGEFECLPRQIRTCRLLSQEYGSLLHPARTAPVGRALDGACSG
jgi:hypothetical protein